jgi:sigma-B regulation protein RsbU (phosphoserine phosphatase)
LPSARTAEYWKSIPPLSTAIFLGAVFCLFGCFGVIQGMVQYERRGVIIRVLWVVISGGFAVGWAFLATRRLIPHMAVLGIVQFLVTMNLGKTFERISTSFDPRSDPALLKHFLLQDAGAASTLLFASYVLMMEFLRREGSRYYTAQTEMNLANEIHRGLVPEVCTTLGDFDFYGRSIPSGEVGGDVLDVIEVDGSWFAYVADVSGHGVPAGVLMTMVKSAARMRLASTGAEGFLEKMNDVLAPLSAPTMFTTLASVRHCGGGQLELASAGHLPALHYRSALRKIEQRSEINFPIALFKEHLEYKTIHIDCEPGDILVLLTDGFTELVNRSGDELGFLPLESLIVEQAGKPLSEIAQSMYDLAQGYGKQADDQTVLLIRRSLTSELTQGS